MVRVNTLLRPISLANFGYDCVVELVPIQRKSVAIVCNSDQLGGAHDVTFHQSSSGD